MRSSWSAFLQSFSSSAAEKNYSCLLEITKWPLCTKSTGMGRPPCDLWRSYPLPFPCHWRHRWQDSENSSFFGAEWQRCWACKTSSCRNIIFTAVVIASVSFDTWYFVFLLYILVLCNVLWLSCCGGLTGEAPSPDGDPRIQCFWWFKLGAPCKDLVLGKQR